MGEVKQNQDIVKMSFEEAISELEKIVQRLESGKQKLEESIEDYTRGNLLKKHAEKKLQEAKLKIEKIIENSDGTIRTEEFAG